MTAAHVETPLQTMAEPLRPVAGTLEAQLHPECGGRLDRIIRYDENGGGFDYLVPLPPAAAWPKEGCFPMLPYASKLHGNAFEWRGRVPGRSAGAASWLGFAARMARSGRNPHAVHNGSRRTGPRRVALALSSPVRGGGR